MFVPINLQSESKAQTKAITTEKLVTVLSLLKTYEKTFPRFGTKLNQKSLEVQAQELEAEIDNIE